MSRVGQSSCHILLCGQQVCAVRRRVGRDLQIVKWSVVEMVKQGRRIKGRKLVKESMRCGREEEKEGKRSGKGGLDVRVFWVVVL
jgi:hypothetical protein